MAKWAVFTYSRLIWFILCVLINPEESINSLEKVPAIVISKSFSSLPDWSENLFLYSFPLFEFFVVFTMLNFFARTRLPAFLQCLLIGVAGSSAYFYCYGHWNALIELPFFFVLASLVLKHQLTLRGFCYGLLFNFLNRSVLLFMLSLMSVAPE
ncbi:hypothetical protein [Undibacterium luofuense]|uniref:Uncharacterized protein n=1 Tax=Undibacterium luofuense TaxID=2828733 RepID=A0A941DQ64_9BURK|nr:hypothetical protein [Undibacterium luofuense]MBR7782071.1 hypothetical protein [Undibacterium luofuense]